MNNLTKMWISLGFMWLFNIIMLLTTSITVVWFICAVLWAISCIINIIYVIKVIKEIL